MGKIAYLCTRNQASTRRQPHCNRDVAQLVAHYVRDVGVGRSSRLIPTKSNRPRIGFPMAWSIAYLERVLL